MPATGKQHVYLRAIHSLDQAAVENALTMEYSNGQVEGQVKLLKLKKRAMFGRANFELLRKRVLYADMTSFHQKRF